MLFVIAGRELRAVILNKRIIFSIVIFLIIWGVVAAPRFISFSPGEGISENGIFYMTTVLSMYIALLLSSQAFINEKRDGRIETLLCSPIDLNMFWFGKVLGVVIPGYIGAIAVSLLLFIGANVMNPSLVIPSAPLLVYLLIGVPFVLAAFTGLLGFIQLYFGMRGNRVFNLVVLLLIFMLLGAASVLIGSRGVFSWGAVAVMSAGSIALLAVDRYLTRFLNKEKIITSSE
jgi:ABC-2 type transport system permease protein